MDEARPAAGAKARVLLVEDTLPLAEVYKAYLADSAVTVEHVETGTAALSRLAETGFDILILDLKLPDMDGLEILKTLHAGGNDAAVIVITAHGSVNSAVEAMRLGAFDFIVKPFNAARLTVTLRNVLERQNLARMVARYRQNLDRNQFYGFVGASPEMQAVYQTIESVAGSRASVFITGESGTGKELAAEALHRASSRRQKPFITLNCAAIPKDLLESEIFGHVRGAFTGATTDRPGAARMADGGTLFLDEIGEMPLDLQAKMLRFIQTGTVQPVGSSRTETVDIRFVAATNRNPLAEVEAGRFREDLYYRLHVIPLHLPALRERDDDVLLLALHFLSRLCAEEGKHFTTLAPEVEAAFRRYEWPGNVRQLENLIRSIVVLHNATAITAAMLPEPLHSLALGRPHPERSPLTEGGNGSGSVSLHPVSLPPLTGPDAGAATLNRTGDPRPPAAAAGTCPVDMAPLAEIPIRPLWQVERELIEAALRQTGNDVPRAAALLEISPSTIYRKLQQWRSGGNG